MRRTLGFLSLLFVLGGAVPAEAQAQRPQFRPAVLGSSPDSLINRIDVKELLKNGQKDGAVMFCALVDKSGAATRSWTYRGMPGTQGLEQEVMKRLGGVKFTPPIYNYQPVSVLLFGTVVFTASSTTHVRILLNQEAKELVGASDFISPQPVIGQGSKFDGLTPPDQGLAIPVTSVVDLRLKVSREGHLQDMLLVAEDSEGLGFGEAALRDFREAKFIPAFRDGDPTGCEILLPICYKP